MRCFDLHYCIFLHRALDVLQTIALSGSRKSGFSDAALECVLDCNLPAKYSLRGYLSSSNIIGQGFYDRGKVSIFNASPLLCLALPCLALPCLAFPQGLGLALPCLALSCLALPCLVLPCLALPCLVLSCLALSCLALPCLVLPCLVLSCLALPCLVLSCLALPCLALPCLAQKTTNILRFIE